MALTRRRFLGLMASASAWLASGCAAITPGTRAADAPKAERPAKPEDLWDGSGFEARVLLQQEIDRLPEGPYMLRVTELEMAPGAAIDPHTHLGPGVQVVLAGAFTIIDAGSGEERVYEASPATPFPVFYTSMVWRYSAENRGSSDNRLFMTEILPRSRGFLGNQQFDQEGMPHNRGGVRSGPYLQQPFDHLPDPPLMVRVTQIDMGPKAKTPEYTRPGPGLFFVVSGQGTFRRQDELFITTNGAGGYFIDPGDRPIILENKPVTPSRLIAVEFLPASLGKKPSTFPTGRQLD